MSTAELDRFEMLVALSRIAARAATTLRAYTDPDLRAPLEEIHAICDAAIDRVATKVTDE